MQRNLSIVVVVAAAIAIMLIAGKHLAKRPSEANAAKGAPAPGAAAPDFSLEALDGKTIRLSDFRGKAVLLNFWATWCEPCRVEMPWFVELEKQYGPEGLQVVGVAMDDSGKDVVEKFAKEMGVNYPVLMGKEAVGEEYGGVEFLPTTFYVDRNGKVVSRVFGLKSRSEIEDAVKTALGPQVAQAR